MMEKKATTSLASSFFMMMLGLTQDQATELLNEPSHQPWASRSYTLHFKNKKLSRNSTRYYNSVLDTINDYWIDPAKYLVMNTWNVCLQIVQYQIWFHFFFYEQF